VAKRMVVVLGGGIGGQVAARSLRRRLPREDRVMLVERTARFSFPPSYLWVLSGARRPAQISRTLHRLQRAGVELLQAEVVGLDLEKRRVLTTRGELAFDRLVVALGAELAPGALPGFGDAAHNIYTLEGATSAAQGLRDFSGRRVVVLVSRLPFKCPAAPYEAAFLTRAVLRRRGLGDDPSIAVYTPEQFPMPTAGAAVGQALAGMLSSRGIEFHPGQSVERIDPAGRELKLASGERVSYDLLLGVPPHRPPEVLKSSPLASDSGFIPVDANTLATGTEGVYAIGDVTAIPLGGGKFLPKAGVFASAEAEVVARRIAAELANEPPTARFDGHGSCFVELGGGIAAYASGDFYAEGGPQVNFRRSGRIWHWSKVALEQYWLRMHP
jgi:sulfide:quinone oxidoreductase